MKSFVLLLLFFLLLALPVTQSQILMGNKKQQGDKKQTPTPSVLAQKAKAFAAKVLK
jgi:hypothetical protein